MRPLPHLIFINIWSCKTRHVFAKKKALKVTQGILQSVTLQIAVA